MTDLCPARHPTTDLPCTRPSGHSGVHTVDGTAWDTCPCTNHEETR